MAEALRRAQLQMIDTAGTGNKPIELSYPNYWAAFALIGDGIRARCQARRNAGEALMNGRMVPIAGLLGCMMMGLGTATRGAEHDTQ